MLSVSAPLMLSPARITAPALLTSVLVKVTTPARPLKLVTPPPAASAVTTNAVVAMLVSLSPGAGVGAVGLPENAGLVSRAPPTALTSLACRVTAPVLPLNEDTFAAAPRAACTKAVVASCVVLVPMLAVGAAGTPVKVGLASKAPPTPVTSAAVRVTAPVRVLNEDTPATTALTAACTKAVVAMLVSLSPACGVGAVGEPVNCGEASSAPPAAEMSLAWKVTAPVRPLNEVTGAGRTEIACVTKAVVAMVVSLSPGGGLGACGLPVNTGEASSAPPTAVTSAEVRATAPVLVLNEVTPRSTAATAAWTKAVVASWVLLVPAVAVGPCGTPVKVGLASSAPPAAVTSAATMVTVPVRPFQLATPVVEATMAAWTKAVVASWPELLLCGAVGAVGMPTNCGESSGAYF